MGRRVEEMRRSNFISPSEERHSSPLGRLWRQLSPIKTRKRSLLDAANRKGRCTDLQRVFHYFDEDGDGKISPVELQNCAKTIGSKLSREEAESAVESVDMDGDGQLGFEDFSKLMESSGEKQQRDLRDAFAMYEMEGSGYITPKSLQRMMSQLGEYRTIENCKDMIRTFDLNGDGMLSFEEFKAMMA